MRRVVLSLHGVDSRGEWQKRVAPTLSRSGLTPYPLDYGRVPHWAMFIPWVRTRLVNWLNKEIDEVRRFEGIDRPSIIAHSLGTHILTQTLKKYRHVHLDNVIFCGSIVDPTFDWSSRLERCQLNALMNEVGGKDRWSGVTKWLRWLIPEVGPSGVEGFRGDSSRVSNVCYPNYSHSDFFQPGHANDTWIPFLHRVQLHGADQDAVQRILDVGRKTVAHGLGIAADKVRANLMLPDPEGRQLHIPDGLAYPADLFHVNNLGEKELDIRIPMGEGSAGLAFQRRTLIIAVFQPGWATHPIPDEELRKAHPDLKWIISAPIPDLDDRYGIAISGVINIDCIGIEKSKDELSMVDELTKEAASKIASVFARLV